jgi:hypothetical protein
VLAAPGNRWTRNPKTRIIRKLIDNLGNRISLIWVPSHAGIAGNEAADQAARDALTEEIVNRETYPPQDLTKWMKKEEAMNRQQRWERGDNESEIISKLAEWHGWTQQKRTIDYILPQNGVYQGHPPTRNRKNWHVELPILRCTNDNRPHFIAVWRNTQHKRRIQAPMHSMERGKRRKQEADRLRQEDWLLPRDLKIRRSRKERCKKKEKRLLLLENNDM